MTDDIKERLRQRAKEIEPKEPDYRNTTAVLFRKAADRIEELEDLRDKVYHEREVLSKRIEELEANQMTIIPGDDAVRAAERERLKPWLKHAPMCPNAILKNKTENLAPLMGCNCGLDAAIREKTDD